MQNKTRQITRLAAEALREREIGKLAFQRSGEASAKLRQLVTLGEKIGPLPQRKRGPVVPAFVRLVDSFAPKVHVAGAQTIVEEVTHAYRPARFDRFLLEEVKEPKEKPTPRSKAAIEKTANALHSDAAEMPDA